MLCVEPVVQSRELLQSKLDDMHGLASGAVPAWPCASIITASMIAQVMPACSCTSGQQHLLSKLVIHASSNRPSVMPSNVAVKAQFLCCPVMRIRLPLCFCVLRHSRGCSATHLLSKSRRCKGGILHSGGGPHVRGSCKSRSSFLIKNAGPLHYFCDHEVLALAQGPEANIFLSTLLTTAQTELSSQCRTKAAPIPALVHFHSVTNVARVLLIMCLQHCFEIK